MFTFYSWEGINGQGYTLRPYTLETIGNSPTTTEGSLANTNVDEKDAVGNIVCSADIFNLSPSAPSYNPDCRQFYDQHGNIFYRLYSKTVTCSDNCHPFRITENDQTKCGETGGSWDPAQSACTYLADSE